MATTRKKKNNNRRYILAGIGGLIVILLVSFICWIFMPVFSKGRSVRFEVQASDSVSDITARMNANADNINGALFALLMTISGKSSGFIPGPYDIRAGESPYRLMQKLANGIYAQEGVTIIEGWTFKQMRKAIDSHPALKHETAGMSDQELFQKLGLNYASGEGLFYPDTYQFRQGASDIKIYQLAQRNMMSKLNKLWENRAGGLPYKSVYDGLIMASIIEKESSRKSDRGMIAGVFINRLKRDMKLQTDPTVIYGMGSRYEGKIHKSDLLRDTPYNTYTRKGLPPTPIALPGISSLEAAFHPTETDALYFVSRGDGTSQFSNNLDDHNKAVEQYILKK